jgi:hypothetical protein
MLLPTRRFFNTAGPCRPDIHYTLPPSRRLPDVLHLIRHQTYFVIHAPRQVGKTTAMMTLAHELTASGQYVSLLVSMEVGAAFNHDPDKAELAILDAWREDILAFLPPELHPPAWDDAPAGQRINTALRQWANTAPRPLVIFLDEIDALQDETLISILRQLRDGYRRRPHAFPHALALIGLRDVRDYKVASGGRQRLHSASPFNIKVASLTMHNFTFSEVQELYQQHTDETGQLFTAEAVELAFELTQGQPWLVNAIAYQITDFILRDTPQEPITPEHVRQAKEMLIRRMDTHLDSLAEKLQEERVRRIIEPMLAGQMIDNVPADDRQYLVDLGLVRRANGGGFVIANPIYREVIPRMLASGPQDTLPRIAPTWLRPDGTLAPDKLLEAFLAFWRQHGQPLLKSAPYHEIAPHLVLMAFLHRVVNGGGRLEREYAIGTRRMDIGLWYGDVIMGMELKVWRDGEKDPVTDGLAQIDEYLAGLGLTTGWLVIFDQRSGLPPISERTTTEMGETPHGRVITIIRG